MASKADTEQFHRNGKKPFSFVKPDVISIYVQENFENFQHPMRKKMTVIQRMKKVKSNTFYSKYVCIAPVHS